MSSTDEILELAREAVAGIEAEDNDFGTASAAWKYWQDAAEELASQLAKLDRELLAGRAPTEWAAALEDHRLFHAGSGLPTPSVLCVRCTPNTKVVPGVGLVAS